MQRGTVFRGERELEDFIHRCVALVQEKRMATGTGGKREGRARDKQGPELHWGAVELHCYDALPEAGEGCSLLPPCRDGGPPQNPSLVSARGEPGRQGRGVDGKETILRLV